MILKDESDLLEKRKMIISFGDNYQKYHKWLPN